MRQALTPAVPSRLRIGVLASIAHRTPPRGYGPWEQVASTLDRGAGGPGPRRHAVRHRRLGHRGAAARRGPDAATRRTPALDAKVYEGLHIAAAFERAGEFDVLSNQFDFLPLTYSRLVSTPVVTTIHGFSSERILPVYRAYDDIAHYVAISDADRHPDLTYDATIHHGIDLARFTFRDRAGRATCSSSAASTRTRAPTGRSRWPGGPGCRWSSPGSCRTRTTSASCVAAAPRARRHQLRRARSGPAERDALLGGALALLHLIGFAEPFGLSVVESLATGTPVIARPLGSMPEIVRHGRTGFLVDDVAGAVEAVGRGRRAVAAGLPGRRRGSASPRRAWWPTTRSCSPASPSGGPSAVSRSSEQRRGRRAANRTDASLAP